MGQWLHTIVGVMGSKSPIKSRSGREAFPNLRAARVNRLYQRRLGAEYRGG